MRSILDLPGEVMDFVIDHLHADFPTLQACTLVCHAWLPAARFHLFNTLICEAAHGRTSTEFVNWASACPAVAPYV
ncbi:uncharacterized protein BXZ73DRAFT_49237, partial [Epithele typhae]|uniref:uncharacterized protein n=1 Tax=Epithele typhae TaxID=378194 RepID=UPI00200856CC